MNVCVNYVQCYLGSRMSPFTNCSILKLFFSIKQSVVKQLIAACWEMHPSASKVLVETKCELVSVPKVVTYTFAKIRSEHSRFFLVFTFSFISFSY